MLESGREDEGGEQQRQASKHAHLDFLIPLMQTEHGVDIAGPLGSLPSLMAQFN